METGFKPNASQRALEKVLRERPVPAELADLKAPLHGGYVATDALRFPSLQSWRLKVTELGRPQGGLAVALPESAVKEAAQLVRRALRNPRGIREEFARFGPIAEKLGSRPVATRSSDRWPAIRGPGIYRREHASLVIRSATTSILLDPSTLLFSEQGIPAGTRVPDLGAIFITHGHEDHWDLPSLLLHAENSRTPVYVPKVGRRSILTPADFDWTLRAIGQSARALAWGNRVKVGDIEVTAYPFYGEQPTREGLGPEDGVRNWGNSYRFDTPQFSVMVLADSGCDPAGSVAEVIAGSVRERGSLDAVVSCLRSFKSPFFSGLERYWSVLPFSVLRKLHADHLQGTLGDTTAGPEGIAEACAAGGVRYLLPYAHGFNGAGRPIRDVGWGAGEASEAKLVRATRAALTGRGAKTRVLSWNSGDRASFKKGGILSI
jgi:hypothetical protein